MLIQTANYFSPPPEKLQYVELYVVFQLKFRAFETHFNSHVLECSQIESINQIFRFATIIDKSILFQWELYIPLNVLFECRGDIFIRIFPGAE